MKITLFIGGLRSGGAEHVIVELANYLSNKHEVTILTWSNCSAHYLIKEQVNLVSCRSGNYRNRIIRIIESYKNLKRYVKETNVDCYVVFLATTVYLLLSLRKFILNPIIFSVRCYPREEYGGLVKGLLSRILLRLADGIVYQTEEQKHYMRYLSQITSAIIPNAVNVKPEYMKSKEDIQKESGRRIIAIGRLSKQKNYKMMITVMSKILKDYPEYHLDIYGEGPEKDRLQRLIKQSYMQEKIHLCGVTVQMIEKLKTAELFLMTSDYEGISNALIEAMTVGVTVVATDCLGGGARLLIQDGKNGLLVPRGDKLAFEKAVRKVLDDRELKVRLAQNAREIQKTYSRDVIYGKWERFIESVVESR